MRNVKDFGAIGNGVANDLDAINRALRWQTSTFFRGSIYFPAGTYLVSGPVDTSEPDDQSNPGILAGFVGDGGGLSIITGNFADYILKRGIINSARVGGPWFVYENLTIVNQAAGGGGIRIGASQGIMMRNLDITADICINDDNTEQNIDGGNLNGAFENTIECCNLRPQNTRAAGTIGIYKLSNGPVKGCRMVGFDVGAQTASGQGGAVFQGCYFELNTKGFAPGKSIEAWGNGAGGNMFSTGLHFKDNGTAIDFNGGSGNYRGIFIEAATGTIPGNPQYGIKCPSNRFSGSIEGLYINGNFAVAGVYIEGTEATQHFSNISGASVTNTGAGVAWSLPGSAGAYTDAKSTKLEAVNFAPVFTVNGLPAINATVAAGTSWSSAGGGTVTLNFTSPVDVSGLATKSATVTVTGVTPSGYNVSAVVGTMVGSTQLTYPLVSDPGSYTSGGSVFFSAQDIGGNANVYEGETFNVSDANTATWGAAVTGGGANHVKVRYTPAAWTVVGK